MKKTVLITGASSGFGLMLANQLHQQGFNVIGRIADYNTYRKQVNAATQKGMDDAEAPDAVVNTIAKLIATKQPKFSNPVGKMTGMILFLQSYLPKMFEGSILKSVSSAA